MRSLIFFDINGTLIMRDSRTDIPFYRAIDRALALSDGMAGIDTSAKSDMLVFREVLANHQLTYTDALWQRFLDEYRRQLDAYKSSDVWRINVDARQCVESLATTDHYLALLTGELSIGAQYKLEKIGLWHHFAIGGFGEDGFQRFDIAEVAQKKAIAHFGNDFDNIYVIGDTRLDIKTARHIGAKIISITTGANSRDELMTLAPDYIIDRFAEIADLF